MDIGRVVPGLIAMLESASAYLNGWILRVKGDSNKKSKFLNVRQRKSLRLVHSAWEPVDDQSEQLH
jgi:hypothetical protein